MPISDNFVVRKDIPSQQLTKIYEIDNTTYKVYGNNQGIVLQESSTNKNENFNINLIKENKEYNNFTPMTLSKTGEDIIILVHYYHPVEDGGMASGLYMVEVGKSVKTDKIDLRGQCCINYEIEPVIIDDNIYVNTYGNIGSISISKKSFNTVPYFDTLKNEAQSNPNLAQGVPDSFKYQPVIGKLGNILLLSYGGESTNYIWGIHADKVIFKIITSNSDIFDDTESKIGSTNRGIEKVLLPNW